MNHTAATTTLLILAAALPTLVLLCALNTAHISLRGGLRWQFGRPWSTLGVAFGLGVLSAFPAYCLERVLVKAPWTMSNLGAVFLFWLLVAGAVEETCKFAAVQLAAGRARLRWEDYDGILVAAAVALGFACIENMLYVHERGFDAAKARALTAVPAHAMFGIIMGAGLGVARTRARFGWSSTGLALSALALAIAAHGVYDALASMPWRVALPSICLCLTVLGSLSVYICAGARRRSPAFGGRRSLMPHPLGPLRMPALPARRDPVIAGSLGLIPGLGQAYNGEVPKALLFFSVGLVNLSLYYVAHLFVSDPAGAISLLHKVGVTVAISPDDLSRAVAQKTLLKPTLLSLVFMWELLGACEAWATARRRWPRPETHSVRRSFASHGFGASYVIHVGLVFLLVIAPVADQMLGTGGADPAEAAEAQATEGQDGAEDEAHKDASASGADAARGAQHEWKLTWVKAPVHIEGWKETPEGTESAKAAEASRQTEAIPSKATDDGDLALPTQPHEQAQVQGESGSYNQYLSYQIRRHHADMHFFRFVGRDLWAVVHYRIARDGRLLEAELVKYGGGPPQEAQRAVEVVQRAAPFEPLPEGARELDVTELFWSVEQKRFTPGTLEAELSGLPDGRRVNALH
ncbi:MAG: PrsW family intramembrane metalloprotease [Proteobacteria bacterium]|nr:PrsW family intramembrane metalloprotease [Pseudomonadota bacterium]